MTHLLPLIVTLAATTQPEPVTITWYDHGGGTTFCGQPFSAGNAHVAHPSLPCGTRVRLCAGDRCVLATVDDRVPPHSARVYRGAVFDVTPPVLAAMGVPFGRTTEGIPYGRARGTWERVAPPAVYPEHRPL